MGIMRTKQKRKCHQTLRYEAGYSLIEIAIALVIIGLVIGAAIKGYDVLENAQLKSIMMQSNEYRLAIHSFEEKYGAFPGTFKEASQVLNGLDRSYDGSGGSALEKNGLDKNKDEGKVWIQLAAANLIGDPGIPDGGDLQFGKGAPTTKLGGGFTIEYSPEDDLPGLWFVVGEKNGNRGNGALFTPQQAMQFLKQFDSDHPKRGRVRAKDGANAAGKCLSGEQFNLTHSDRACVLYMRF